MFNLTELYNTRFEVIPHNHQYFSSIRRILVCDIINGNNIAPREGDFAAIRFLYDDCLQSYPSLTGDFTELSIGMSDDYPVALRYGSTMVRIGSMIFGSRGN